MAEGLDGIVDFVGYGVAQPENVPQPAQPVGCLGFLDFTCIPVACPPPRIGGGSVAAGKKPNRMLQAWAMAEQQRSLLQEYEKTVIKNAMHRVLLHKLAYEHEVVQQKQIFTRNVNAVLLSEI